MADKFRRLAVAVSLGFLCVVAVAFVFRVEDRHQKNELYGADPTMPSPLMVGSFGRLEGGGGAGFSASGRSRGELGCLFERSVCEHPVAVESTNLWAKGEATCCSVLHAQWQKGCRERDTGQDRVEEWGGREARRRSKGTRSPRALVLDSLPS